MPFSVKEWIVLLIRRNLFRAIKYSLAGDVGFLSLEALTYIFVTEFGYRYILPIDAASFFLAVAAEFLINEYWTTRKVGYHEGYRVGLIIRLGKYEVLNLVGNAIAIAIQVSLLHFFNLNPLLGNIIGSGVAFPFNYLIHLRIVWSIRLSD